MQSQLYSRTVTSSATAPSMACRGVESTKYSHIFKERQAKRLFTKLSTVNYGSSSTLLASQARASDEYDRLRMQHIEIAKKLI